MNDKNNLFRRTAIESVRSPEQLNDYIRVTTPGVWTILVAIIILLGAGLVWAVFGSVEITHVVDGQQITEWIRPIEFIS